MHHGMSHRRETILLHRAKILPYFSYLWSCKSARGSTGKVTRMMDSDSHKHLNSEILMTLDQVIHMN